MALALGMLLTLFFSHPFVAQAAPPSSLAQTEAIIPRRPSAPPPLAPKGPPEVFRCQRQFVHDGKDLPCDSYVRMDGQGLRPILQSVPEALSELETYQGNRKKIRNAAYAGTLGLATLVVGVLVSTQFRDSSGNPTPTSEMIHDLSIIGGGGLAAGGFLYALSFIKTNETHLANAVDYYNRAKPDSPIQLKFTAEMNF